MVRLNELVHLELWGGGGGCDEGGQEVEEEEAVRGEELLHPSDNTWTPSDKQTGWKQKHLNSLLFIKYKCWSRSRSDLRSVSGAAGTARGKVCVAPGNHGVCNRGDGETTAEAHRCRWKLRLLQVSTATSLKHSRRKNTLK